MPWVDFEQLKRDVTCLEVLTYWGWREVGRRCGRLRRGPCPFHGSRPTSRSLELNGSLFKCHSCQERGDVIRLAALLQGWRMFQAAQWLQATFGHNRASSPLPHTGTGKRLG